MFWTTDFFPRCEHHVFLSHCAEDRTGLIHPIYNTLRERGIRGWLDLHDYPYGRGSRAALRDAIIGCRHVVFLVTDAMLTQARGWCVQELAWTELLQENLVQAGGPLQNVFLPLYFVEPSDRRLPRSVWQAARDRGAFCPVGRTHQEWAVDQIEAFLRREEQIATKFRKFSRRNEEFRTRLRAKHGLFDRVTRFDPQPLRPRE